jgi:hypothetical protein
MSEPNVVVAERVILTQLSAVVHQYTWMAVEPAFESIPRVEHSFPIVVAWHYQHIYRSGLSTHVYELYEQFPAFAKGLLPTRVLDRQGSIHGKLPCPVHIEEVVPQREEDATNRQMFDEFQQLTQRMPGSPPCYLDVIILPGFLRPGKLPEV